MESRREGLKKEQAKNDMKDSTIEELNEKVCRISEEKMRLKSENDRSIEEMELSKKVAEDEHLSEQELAKAAIVKLEEAMSLQQQQHSDSTKRSNDILRSMEEKVGVTEKKLNDIKVKCVQNEEKLDENEKEILRLRKERECNEVEMEEKMKLISMRDEELNEMRTQWDIEEELETVKSLKSKNTSLEDEICEMRVVMESTAAGLQKEKLNNDIKDSKVEELNEKVRRISEEKMRMKNENDKSIEDLELSKRKAEDEHLSQQEVAKKTMWELEEAMSLQQQQHLSSTEIYMELLRSMEVKVSVAEEMLNDS